MSEEVCRSCKKGAPTFDATKRRCWKCRTRACALCGSDTGSVLIANCDKCSGSVADVYDSEGNVDPYYLPSSKPKPGTAAPEVPAAVRTESSERELPKRRKKRE